jgi:hypothetical protein
VFVAVMVIDEVGYVNVRTEQTNSDRARSVPRLDRGFLFYMTLPFTVVRAFNANSAISSRERRFEPGETLLCDTGQTGAIVTIEVDKSLFLIGRPTFETCCKFKNEGAPFF